jgi:hypothetical protein
MGRLDARQTQTGTGASGWLLRRRISARSGRNTLARSRRQNV